MPCADDCEELSARMPSMIRSGSFEREMEFDPRMRMREPAPVSPAACCTTTPATRELSASDSVLIAALGMAELSIVAVGAPLARLSWVSPVAVMVRASSVVTAGDIVKSAVVVFSPETTTKRDATPYPMRWTASWTVPAGTPGIRYAPESFVAAPRVVPTTRTWTPESGRFVVRSITRPTMVPVLWASAGEARANAAPAMRKRRTTKRMSVSLLSLRLYEKCNRREHSVPGVLQPADVV